MDFSELLLTKRSAIIKKWFDLIVETYPPDTETFLRRQKDAMANPVGSSIRDGLDGIIDCLVAGVQGRSADAYMVDWEALEPHLDRIVRVRALQNFAPSQSVRFAAEFGPALWRILVKEAKDQGLEAELKAMTALMADLVFMAFDVYAACRERLHEIRIKDEQRRVALLLRRANILTETDKPDYDFPDLREDRSETNHEER
jgi:hypothetical protein